ncbi:MAG: sulfite exporter TauE/SafE family protein [Candidatus Methylacidiphilales bacterium]
MQSFSELLSHGSGWLFIPTAVVLGALHGLEPGHSKTMMAAFIIAVRGTVMQAVLLGVAATISHTAIIWLLAAIGLHFAARMDVEAIEPYLQFASGLVIVGLSGWMLIRTRNDLRAAVAHSHNERAPHGGNWIATGHELLEISVFEDGVPPRFRVYAYDDKRGPKDPAKEGVSLRTIRPNDTVQNFALAAKGDYLESVDEIPEPHEFKVECIVAHKDHSHLYVTRFTEADHSHGGGRVDPHAHAHPHDDGGHSHSHAEGDAKHEHSHSHAKSSHTHEGHAHGITSPLGSSEYQDEHERAHAADFARRFSNQNVTTGQVILFGLTGGLLPCPAAFSVLLLCLQTKREFLGFSVVLAFSVGLALTLVTVGAVAAISVNYASKRFSGLNLWVRRLPYRSSGVLGLLGIYLVISSAIHIAYSAH